jgi:NhaP-type Na+/H+ or K+/H+ antiporter
MSTVGIFAGRGDVVLSMGLSLLFGCMIGWQARRLFDWAMSLRATRNQSKEG